MKGNFKPGFIVFAVAGGALLLNLIVPIAVLLLHADWAGWMDSVRQPAASEALRVSVISSLIAVAIMVLLGVPLGYVLARAAIPFKPFWIALVFLPMVVPGLAGGMLLLETFGPNGPVGRTLDSRSIELTNNLAGIVLAQLFVASPFVIISSLTGFAGVDPELEAAAAILGDSQWQIFRRVSLRLAWPGIAAGITLAWIRALGEFGATLIMAYNPHSLPVYLWVKFESDGLRGALPVALTLVAVGALAVATSMLLNQLRTRSNALALLPHAARALAGLSKENVRDHGHA